MSRDATASPAPEKVLAALGLVGLGIITLWPPGTSQMHAWPGEIAYWIALLVPVLGLMWHFRSVPRGALPARPWTAALLGLAVVVLLSALLSPYRGIVLRWSAPWLAGVALFFWLHSRLQSTDGADLRTRLELGLALAGAVVAVTSLVFWLPLAARHVSTTGSLGSALQVRNAFPLGHANYTAGAMLLGLPWILRQIFAARGGPRVAWTLALAIAAFVLFSSGSRGGLIGLAVLVAAELVARQLPWRRLLLFGAGALVLAGGLALGNPRVRSLLAAPDPAAPPNASSVQRRAMLQAGALMGADRPLLGWGLHATPLVYPRYRGRLDGGAENVLQLHSAPVEIWSGLGTAGLAAVLLLAGLAVAAVRRQPGAAGSLLGYGAFALTDYQLDVPFVVAVLATTGALIAPRAPPRPTDVHVRRVAPLLGFAAVALVALLGHSDPAPRLNVAALSSGNDVPAAEPIAMLEQSLTLNPDQEIAHFNLGWLLLVADADRAAAHFRTAATLVPDKGGVYFGRGLAALNADHPDAAVHAFALECLNDPAFLVSPWWTVPPIAALRPAVIDRLRALLDDVAAELPASDAWRLHQVETLRTRLPDLSPVPPAEGISYRRERRGYPVLMRNLDLPPPDDLFDVREPLPDSPLRDLPLPPKGWLPGPLLLKRLDPPGADVQ